MTPAKPTERSKSLSSDTAFIMAQNLWLKILIGMALGVIIGLLLSPESVYLFGTENAFKLKECCVLLDKETAFKVGEWFALPGVMFLGLIQMVIIPLVTCSIILGITDSGSMAFLKHMGMRIVPYFIMTTVIAITIGICFVNITQPGFGIDQDMVTTAIESGAANDRLPQKNFQDLTIPQRIGNVVPSNLAKAELDRNMLQIVIAAILAGIALLSLPGKAGKPILDLCVAGQILTMKIISWAMLLAPYAVFGLLCNITIRIGLDALISVGLYMITVLIGLGCMMCVYLLIVAFFTNIKLKDFMAGIRGVQLLAFSTSSSGATMPFSIQAAEENLKIKPEISRFIIPLGATINMDGTALYQAVAAVFLCQVFGVDLSLTDTILLLLTTVGASIGTPATPGVGIAVLATILVGIGVPPEGIGLIIGVDRILDMCRTTVNVTGDLTATAVMQKWVPLKRVALP